jgi:hypothetical protein
VIDGDPNVDRIPCALDPSDALVIADGDGLRTPGFPSLYLVVHGASHDVVLNLAGVTALRDRCDVFIREHAPRHCSEDISEKLADELRTIGTFESAPGEVGRVVADCVVPGHVSPSGRVHPYVTGEDIHPPLDQERK